jgi:hypothetical protein
VGEEWIYQILAGPREVLLGFAGRIFGHYLFSPVVTFLKEGGVQGFRNFAWPPNSQKY